MMGKEPLLSIRLEGEAVGEGRIGVHHLLRLLTEFNKALLRSCQILFGESYSMRKGPKDKQIKDIVALDLVQLSHGSQAAVLGFERHKADLFIPELDPGIEALEIVISGLKQAQTSDQSLPAGYDRGVLMAWRDLGMLLETGVKEIQFTLNGRRQSCSVKYTHKGYVNLQKRIEGPNINIRTIEGRLLMADFKEHGTRCRIHPSFGDPVMCLFGDGQKEEVYDNILHYVRVIGVAREDPVTGKITEINLHDIHRLEDKETEQKDLLPKGTPVPSTFWQSKSLQELAAEQHVKPIEDIDSLRGDFWPEEERIEEFITEIHRWRRED